MDEYRGIWGQPGQSIHEMFDENRSKKGAINDLMEMDLTNIRKLEKINLSDLVPVLGPGPAIYTYKIWDIKKQKYVDNAGGYSTARAPYDCFPELSVKRIAGRLLGKGNYEVHKFSLIREE